MTCCIIRLLVLFFLCKFAACIWQLLCTRKKIDRGLGLEEKKLEQKAQEEQQQSTHHHHNKKKCEHNCNNILCNYHCKWEKRRLVVEFSCLHCEPARAALYTIAIANSAMDDPRSKSREPEGEAQVWREGISYHIKSGEDSIGFQYWFLCNRDTNVRLHSYIATCKLSYRKFPRWSISSSSL